MAEKKVQYPGHDEGTTAKPSNAPANFNSPATFVDLPDVQAPHQEKVADQEKDGRSR